MAKDLVPLRLEAAGMANRLFELIGVRPEQASEKQRQQLAAYAFGMAFALGQTHQLAPVDVHALTISYLRDVFRYTDSQCVQFSELLIQATQNPSPQPKLKAISERGITGYTLLKQGQIDKLRADVQDLLGLAAKPVKAAKPQTNGVGQFRATREKLYQRFFGPKFTVERESGPDQPPIDIFTFEPGHDERDFYTIVTSGLSDLPMKVPEGGVGARAEIILYVDEPKDHYLHVIRWLARMPHAQGRWFCPGTTMNNGNPPEPIFEGSRLDCFLFFPTWIGPEDEMQKHLVLGGDPVQFLWLVPITSAECAFIIKNSPDEFLRLITEQGDPPFILDERRKSYVKSKRG